MIIGGKKNRKKEKRNWFAIGNRDRIEYIIEVRKIYMLHVCLGMAELIRRKGSRKTSGEGGKQRKKRRRRGTSQTNKRYLFDVLCINLLTHKLVCGGTLFEHFTIRSCLLLVYHFNYA